MKRRSVVKRELPQIEAAIKTRKKETPSSIDNSGTKKTIVTPENVAKSPNFEITKRIVETPRAFHRKVAPIASTSATVPAAALTSARKSNSSATIESGKQNILNQIRQMPNKTVEVAKNRETVDRNASKGRPPNRRETAQVVEVPVKKPLSGKVKVEEGTVGISFINFEIGVQMHNNRYLCYLFYHFRAYRF